MGNRARQVEVQHARLDPGDPLVGVDLATAEVPGLRSVVADVRALPFSDGSFDLAFCISTLEHVGRDNKVYDVDAGRDDAGDEAALRELHRVLTKNGRLIVSVPTGVPDDQGWQVQRTPEDPNQPGCQQIFMTQARQRSLLALAEK